MNDEINVLELEKMEEKLTKVRRVGAPEEIGARAGQRGGGGCTPQDLADRSSCGVKGRGREGALSPVLTMWLAGRPPGPVLRTWWLSEAKLKE